MWLLAWVSSAFAHNGAVPLRGVYDWSQLPKAEPGAWIVWEFYPSIVLGCLLFSLIYECLAGPWRERWGLSPVGPTRGDRIRFHGAIAVVFFSLQGPMHELSDVYLFSGHMVQHLLITLIFPPLALSGIPGWMWKPVLDRPALRTIGAGLTHPLVSVVLCTGLLYLWHIPAMYDWALTDHNVHIAEHLSFMTGYVILWWPATNRSEGLPALSAGWKMIYLFLSTIPMKALGALITVSDYLIYSYYATQPRVFDLDPLTDQRVGGLIMWLPGGLVFWFSIGWVFFTQYYGDMVSGRRGANPVEAK